MWSKRTRPSSLPRRHKWYAARAGNVEQTQCYCTAVIKHQRGGGYFEIVDFAYPAIAIKSRSVENDARLFSIVYNSLPQQADEAEPMMNIVVWKEGLNTVSVVFPRRKHRPDCYSKEGDEQYLISPGALDMGGLLILPRQTDFERIDERLLMEVMKEVVLPTEAMQEVTEKIRNKGI